ncbi:acyl carrier protein [Burkholderia plantarii]|uniref:Carrier domain-containing protein n=1 Tax=Burkholderia plantarii TaxID=41899 RepID=A0A0B6RM86_BURPL|nr:acyl carrier protein [Burkholderia plantarii]AJK46407.1 hypothetical protein BGL_1c18980 [Burkholderia plantarii]GLZ19037.1 hypothetical protein Bpla01_25670 [Burkholderia plantarii]
MKEALKQYLQTNFLFEFDEQVTEDSDLFEAGILDSFGYIHLISHLEREYGVRFDEGESEIRHAVSLTQLVTLVESKRREPVQGES